jgi:photosystem II stability/assembly factor-like uncharacterized protein
MSLRHIFIGFAAATAGLTLYAAPQTPSPFNEQLLKAFQYRNTGPFRMQARIAAIAVPDAPAKDHLNTYYVAPWIGGVFKTTNNGTTFEPVSDQQDNLSIGAIAIAHSNSNIVWVGSGDAYTSRSSYAGDGIYKSTDAGRTWKNMGLADTHHIAKIAIDPSNPDIVYAATMGHLYSTNSERGVYKTTNGGVTWEKILFVNDRVGVIDLVMHPTNPSILYAATYEKDRMPWQIVNGGPESGIYKSIDAGKTWTKLGGGLPTGKIGRIGLTQYLRNPEILYAVIENSNARTTPLSDGRGGLVPAPTGGRVNVIGGEVYRTANGGQTWTKQSADDYNVSPKGPYYFSQIFVDPNNEQNLFVTQDGFRHSLDEGKTWTAFPVFPRMFGDVRTLWIDPENSDRMIQGSDGGIAVSYDGGRSSDALSNMPLGSVYMLGVDMEEPYNIYAGLQDHEHWRGPSNGPMGHVTEQDWLAVGAGDGIYTSVDPTDSRWLYTTREYGTHVRFDQKLGYPTPIKPVPASGSAPYRFLWEPPIVISPHQSSTIYAGAQMLLRSTDRGDHWTEISPDLSTHPADKIFPESEGSVPGGIPWFAISWVGESAIVKGLIWAGTADGQVHVTRDDGKAWTDVTPKIDALGGRPNAYVSRVKPSSHVAGRAYVSRSGYKFDDFTPYLYVTDDFGATWRSIAANLPSQPINVITEDPVNPNLLFVGNDTGVFVSIDRGAHWVKMNNGIPNIPIRDILVHPRQHDLILGSYGRGIFVTNIAALEELNDEVLNEDVHLFKTPPTVQRVIWSYGANDYLFGQHQLQTPNEPNGMVIRYYLKTAIPGGAAIAVTNASGQEVARLQGTSMSGINQVLWSTRLSGGRGARGGGGGSTAPAPASNNPIDQWAPLGDYTVTVTVGGKTLTQTATIAKTQGWTMGIQPEIIR